MEPLIVLEVYSGASDSTRDVLGASDSTRDVLGASDSTRDVQWNL